MDSKLLLLAVVSSASHPNASIAEVDEDRASAARIQSVVPLLVCNQEGGVVAASSAWVALTGWHPRPGDDIEKWLAEHSGASAAPSPGEDGALHLLSTSQGERALLISRARIPASTGEGFLYWAVDESSLERKRAKERADGQKLFVATLAHEIRNPLAAICGAIAQLRIRDGDDEYLAKLKALIDRQAEQLTRLSDGLIDVARILHGKIALRKRPLDLGQLVGGLVRDETERFARKSVSLHYHPPSSPVWVEGDEVRLSQVVQNLLTNAFKFTPAPGSVSVSVRDERGHAVLSIRDTGCGMTNEELTAVFEPFRQVTAEPGASDGLGLGLAIVRGIVELHGGVIKAMSEGRGHGSTFVVELPETRA